MLVGLVATLAGCGGTSDSAPAVTAVPALGGTVTVGIDQAPTGCNPNTASGDTVANRLVLSLVLPSAFVVNEQGQAEADQALIEQAELQSTSPETVVYTINPKAVWSDGVPITATDFIYAWQHQRSVPLGETGGDADVASTAGYDDISTMTPSNHDRTLKVVFSTPYADWRRLFENLLPAHVLDKTGWSPPCTNVDPSVDLSGGPYEITTVSRTKITLSRNPRWWGQQPRLARIVVRVADSPVQLAHWMLRRKVNIAAPSFFGPTFLHDVTSMPSAKSAMNISSTFLELEFSMIDQPTANALVREGVAYSVDRQILVDRVASWADVAIAPSTSHLYAQGQTGYPTVPAPVPANSTTTTTVTSTVPATTTTIAASTFPTDGDPVEEARALEAAGYQRDAVGSWVDFSGHALDLRLAVDSGDGWAAQAGALLAEQLRAQGIAITTIDAPDAQSAGADLAGGRADLALVPLRTTPYPTQASSWYTPLLDLPGSTGAQDWSGYGSAKVENLFSQAAKTLNPVTAQPIYDEIDQQLWADMVALPLFAEPTVLAWSAMISGVTPGPYWSGLFSTVLDWARLVNEPASYTGTPRLPGAPRKGA
jgi:peptide/nickel transport system substrate-binding protein